MYKKTLLMVLMLTLCLFIAACGKGADEGTIGDVDLSESEAAEDNAVFTKLDSPYEYEYGSFSIRKAHLKFDVPSTWESTFVNARYSTFQTPVDDGFLPDTTISILVGYGENVDEDEMSEYTMNNHAYNFSEFFKAELEGLPTQAGGRTRHLRSYVAEDEIRNGLAFVDEDHVEDAATLVANSVVLVDAANNFTTGQYGTVSTYVKWDHTPVCITAVVDTAYLDNAVAIMEYMASSFTYEKAEADGFKDVSYKDVDTAVPSTFVPVEGAENIFYSSLLENRATAGMSVGVFTIDSENKSTLTADNMSTTYGQVIADSAFATYGSGAAFYVYASEGEEKDGPDFTSVISVDGIGDRNAADVAGSVFGPYTTYKADYYVADKGGRTFIVAVIYQDNQKALAETIGKEAVNKLKAK